MSVFISRISRMLPVSMFLGGAVVAAAEQMELPVTAYDGARLVTARWGEIGGAVEKTAPDADTGAVLAFRYDFSKCPDPNNSYLRFDFSAPCPGMPQAFHCRIGAAQAGRPLAAKLWLLDKSGEIYLPGVTVDWDGWRDVVFPVPSSPAWRSGDGNGKLDYPATVLGIGVDWPGAGAKTGTLRFTPLRVTTTVDQDTCLGLTFSASDWSWGTATVPVALKIDSHAKAIQARYAGTLTVQDAYWQRPAATRTFEVTLPLTAPSLTKTWDIPLPKGFYTCHAELRNAATGAVAAAKEWNLRVLMPACTAPRGDFLLAAYEYHWSPMRGSVFGDFPPPLADRMGARGVRLEPSWASLEPARGRYAWDGLHQAVRELTAANVAIILLQTLYNGPTFIDPKDNPGFSAAYGAQLRHQAAEFAGQLKLFELGNEDNGSMKSAYTEVARNAAAGIRSVQPLATLASTGIAGVDHTFIRQQARRGLFDYLDVISVHPYTNNSTPSQAVSAERFHILSQLDELNALAFDMGGMKALWSTEFGWPNADAQGEHDRADLYVRELMIAEAAGLEVTGLYTWNRDYNLVNYPAGIAVHAFAKLREGHRLVGLTITDGVWTAVYERSGVPLAVVWTPDDQPKPLPAGLGRDCLDLFGNPLSASAVRISQSPVYVRHPAASTVAAAAAATGEKWANLFVAKAAGGGCPPELAPLLKTRPTDAAAVNQALLNWAAGRSPVVARAQAFVDVALKWQLAVERTHGAGRAGAMPEFPKTRLTTALVALNRDDLDVPAVRRLIALADRTGLEMQLAVAAGQATYQARCAASLEVLARCADRFQRDGLRRQFALFTNLYMDRGGKLGERLYFVPGKPGTVKVRVTSWSKRERTATVRPNLPPGWSCRPVSAHVRVAPGTAAWTEFEITAPAAAKSGEGLRVLTCLSGAPDVAACFDDVEIVPAIDVTVLPVAGLLPGTPLRLELANQESVAAAGTLKLMAPGTAGKPVAILVFQLAPAEKKTFIVNLDAVPAAVAAEWKFDAQFALADGRLFTLPGKDIDFAAATAAPAPLAIDGNPAKWRDALPLRLDQPEYARGSYGNGWSPEDGSATTCLMWDKEYLYFAARVTDQTFNQLFAGDSMWKQDSIQLVFAMPGSRGRDGMKEFTLALSPAGPKIWDGGEAGLAANRYLDEAKVFIRYADKTISYEAAIPWTAFGPAFKEVLKGGTILYALAVNDDDAIGGRKFLERFPGSVVYGKDVNTLVPVRLTGPAPAKPALVPGGVGTTVFFDDFATYPAGSFPAGYDRLFHDMAPDAITVAKTDGRKVLRLRSGGKWHTGFDPGNVPFAILQAPLQLEPGAAYELQGTLKGHVSADGAGTTLGVCSDRWGNQDFQYVRLPETMKEWTPVSLRFGAPMTGEFRLMLRDRAEACDLLIRDLRIVRTGR